MFQSLLSVSCLAFPERPLEGTESLRQWNKPCQFKSLIRENQFNQYFYKECILRLVQDGRVEEHALTLSCKSTRIPTNCWTITDRKTMEFTKKDTPHPKTKEKPQWDGRRGAITIKSNPITAGWVTHKLEDTYTTEVPPTGVKVLSPTSGFPTWGSGNGRRNSQRIKHWRQAGFDYRTSTGLGETETPLLEGTHKVVCTCGPRGRSSDPIGDWTRPTC